MTCWNLVSSPPSPSQCGKINPLFSEQFDQMLVFTEACSRIENEIHHLLACRSPILVAIDGGSGAGKSTLTSLLAQKLDFVGVPLDDFFAAHIPDWEWDRRSIPERNREVFDWKKLRSDALEPLLAGKSARWRPFDFVAGIRPDGTYALCQQAVEKQPASVIILEGTYSSHPEIADLIDLKILIDVPIHERHQRLEKRESDPHFLRRWHTLWDEVEAYYFLEVMPPSAFDLIVPGSDVSKRSSARRCLPRSGGAAVDA